MSLLDAAMETCVMLDRRTIPDGYGGYTYTWEDGATFEAAFAFDQSVAAKTAAVQGVKDLYTVTTRRNINLQFHDVLRRVRDEKIFRITSDGDDKFTPKSASLDMRVVSAEEWRLTDG